MNILQTRRLSVLILAGGLAAAAPAQDADQPPAAEPDEAVVQAPQEGVAPAPDFREQGRPITINLKGGANATFEAKVGDSDDDVAVYRVDYGVDVGIPVLEADEMIFSYQGEYSHYEFDNVRNLIPGTGTPFSDIHLHRVMGRYRRQINPDWTLTGGGYVQTFSDPMAEVQDSMTAGVFALVGYRVNASFTVYGGGSVEGQLEDNTRVTPWVTIDWQFHDQWRLYTRPEISGGLVTLTYTPDPELSLTLDAGYSDRQFRLDDDGVLPDAAVSDRRFDLGLGAIYRPFEGLSVSARGGMNLWQEFEVYEESGESLDVVKTDPAPFVAFRVSYRF